MKTTRMNEIAAAFGTNEEKIREIAGKTLDEMLDYFHANGYDFTIEELEEFAGAVQKMAKTGEFSEEELENVAGGSVIVTCSLIGGIFALLGANQGIWALSRSYDRASSMRYRGR